MGSGIALILLHMTMPVVSGEETLRRLRRFRSDVLVFGHWRIQRDGGSAQIWRRAQRIYPEAIHAPQASRKDSRACCHGRADWEALSIDEILPHRYVDRRHRRRPDSFCNVTEGDGR